MKKNYKIILYGILSSLSYFLIFGVISAVFSNPFFTRMTPVRTLDWTLIILSSILIGIFTYQYFLLKSKKTFCSNYATGGGILAFLAFVCPVCNKLILLLLGFSGAMTYFAPIQPIIGIIGILLLMYGNYILFKQIRKNNKK